MSAGPPGAPHGGRDRRLSTLQRWPGQCRPHGPGAWYPVPRAVLPASIGPLLQAKLRARLSNTARLLIISRIISDYTLNAKGSSRTGLTAEPSPATPSRPRPGGPLGIAASPAWRCPVWPLSTGSPHTRPIIAAVLDDQTDHALPNSLGYCFGMEGHPSNKGSLHRTRGDSMRTLPPPSCGAARALPPDGIGGHRELPHCEARRRACLHRGCLRGGHVRTGPGTIIGRVGCATLVCCAAGALHSQPRSSAMRTASARLRAPTLAMAADR